MDLFICALGLEAAQDERAERGRVRALRRELQPGRRSGTLEQDDAARGAAPPRPNRRTQ